MGSGLSGTLDWLATAPFGLLLAAVLSLWWRREAWVSLLLGAVATGYYTGALHGLAALWIVLCFALAWLFGWVRDRADFRGHLGRWPTMAAATVFFFYALAMSLALLPGFNRVVLVPELVLSPGAEPYDIAIGFPKVVCGMAILGILLPSRPAGIRAALRSSLPVLLVTVLAVMLFTLAAGYTALAPKWTLLFLLWAPINLFFTCLAEEAFFRGFVQRELAGATQRPLLAWLIAAVFFGLAHFKGGWLYVCAGALAGLGYGWAYLRTQRVEAAMAVHFGVNATHFLLFVYPRLT